MNKKPDPQLELASEVVAAMQPRLIAFLVRQGVKDHEQQHDIIQDTVIKLGAHFRRRGDVRTSIQAVHLSRNLLSDLDSELDPLVWRLLRTSKVDCFRREGRFPVLSDSEFLWAESCTPMSIDLDEIKQALPPRNARIVEMLCDGCRKGLVRREFHVGRREWRRIENSIRQVIKEHLN